MADKKNIVVFLSHRAGKYDFFSDILTLLYSVFLSSCSANTRLTASPGALATTSVDTLQAAMWAHAAATPTKATPATHCIPSPSCLWQFICSIGYVDLCESYNKLIRHSSSFYCLLCQHVRSQGIAGVVWLCIHTSLPFRCSAKTCSLYHSLKRVLQVRFFGKRRAWQ